MVLCIDIGNTNVNLGLFQRDTILRSKKVPTNSKYYLTQISLSPSQVEAVIVCSVVPRTLVIIKKELRRLFHKRIFVLGENLAVPIRNLYRNPKEVGQDRLVNAYAGYRLYGGSLIIVDFGTAVTFDVVSQKGDYLGGAIFPGIEISKEALCERAALLPKKLRLFLPQKVVGKSTTQSMRSGFLYGYAYLCKGMIEKIRKESGGNPKVIFTGGDARLLYPLVKDMGRFNPLLTLLGLKIICEDMKKGDI